MPKQEPIPNQQYTLCKLQAFAVAEMYKSIPEHDDREDSKDMKPLRGFVPVGASFSMAMDALRAKEIGERDTISFEIEENRRIFCYGYGCPTGKRNRRKRHDFFLK